MAPTRPKKKVRRAEAQDGAGQPSPSEQGEATTGAVEAEAVSAARLAASVAASEEGGGRRLSKRRKTEDPPVASEGGGSEPAEAAHEEAQGAVVPTVVEKDRRGIVHMGSVPYCMKPLKVRLLMEKYGKIGRIHLEPDAKQDLVSARRRGVGCKRRRYSEGWIEFMDRRIAKRVAEMFNGQPIGGKKRHNFYRDDLWNLRYLPNFKWHQLRESALYTVQVRKARLDQRLSQARKENDFYMEQVEQAKIQKHKMARRARKAKNGDGAGEGNIEGQPASHRADRQGDNRSGDRGAKATFGRSGDPSRKKEPQDGNAGISEKVLSMLF